MTMGALHGSAATDHRGNVTVTSAPDAHVRIAVIGMLDLAVARRLEDAFNGALDDPAASVLVDLSAVALIDARALHTLLRIVDQAYSPRQEFQISAAVEHLLALAGVRQLVVRRDGLSLAQPRPGGRLLSRFRHAS
jgi:anti-anti-sigma regulatory factor